MEHSDNTSCLHQNIQGDHHCFKCGAINLPSSILGNSSIKPKRFVNPLEVSGKLTYSKLVQDYINNFTPYQQEIKFKFDYRTNRIEILKQFRVLIDKLKFSEGTYYLAIFLTDLIISKHPEIKSQHVGVGCLALAMKYIEIDTTIPDLSYFQILFQHNPYTIEKVKHFELMCLRILNYKLNFITPYNVLNFLLMGGILFESDFPNENEHGETCLKMYSTVFDILKCVIEGTCSILFIDIKYLNYSFFHIAFSCVALVRERCNFNQPWNATLEYVYGIKQEDFQNCFEFVKSTYKNRIDKAPRKFQSDKSIYYPSVVNKVEVFHMIKNTPKNQINPPTNGSSSYKSSSDTSSSNSSCKSLVYPNLIKNKKVSIENEQIIFDFNQQINLKSDPKDFVLNLNPTPTENDKKINNIVPNGRKMSSNVNESSFLRKI